MILQIRFVILVLLVKKYSAGWVLDTGYSSGLSFRGVLVNIDPTSGQSLIAPTHCLEPESVPLQTVSDQVSIKLSSVGFVSKVYRQFCWPVSMFDLMILLGISRGYDSLRV